MKMTLDELRVDSYSTQFSETELTQLKGGLASTPGCVDVAVAAITALGVIGGALAGQVEDHTHTHCDSTTTVTNETDECGNTTTTTTTDYSCNDTNP
jgi:hypothetical protein